MALSLDDYYLQAITDASNSIERALPIAKSMRDSLSDILTSYTGITTVSGTMAKNYTRMLDSSTIEKLKAELTNPTIPATTEQASTDVDINLAGFTCNSNSIKTLSEAVYSYYPLNLSSLSVIPLSLFAATSTGAVGGLQFYVPRYADTLKSLVNSYGLLKNNLISDNIVTTLNENSVFDTTISMQSILTGLSSNVLTISGYVASISINVNSFFIKLDTLSQSAATSRASLLSDLSDSVYSNVVTAPWHQSLVINAVKNGLRKRDMTYLDPYFGLSYVPAVDVKAYNYGLSISGTVSSYIPRTSTAYSYADSIYTSAYNIYTAASNFSNSISRNSEVRRSNISVLGISLDYYKSLFVDLVDLANSVTNLNSFAINTQYHSNWLGIYASEQAWTAYTISTAQSNISTVYFNALSQSNALATFIITYSNICASITNTSLIPIFVEIDRQFSGVSSPTNLGLTQYYYNAPTTIADAAYYLSNTASLGNAVNTLYASALDVETAIIHVLIDGLDPVNSLSTVSALILSVPQMYATMNDIAKPLLNYISTVNEDIATITTGEFLPIRNIESLPTSYTITTVPANAIRNMITTYSASLAKTRTGATGYLADMSSTRTDLNGIAAYIATQLNISILSDLLTSDYVVPDQFTLTDYPGWDFTIQNAPVFDLLSYYPGSNSNLSTALNVAHSIAWKISEIFATVSFPSLISTANSLSTSSVSALNDLNSLSATYANLLYYSNQVGDLTSWYADGYQYERSKALAVYRQDFGNVSTLWTSNYFWPMPPPVYSYLSKIGNVQMKINGLVSNISYIHDIATEIGTAITNGMADQDRIYHDEYLISAIAVCRRTLFLLKYIDVDWTEYIEPLNGTMYASAIVISNVSMPSLSDIGTNLRAYTNLCDQYNKCTGLIVALNSLFPSQVNSITRDDVLSNYDNILTLSSDTLSNVNAFYSLAATWSPYSLYSNTISAYKASISYASAVSAISSLSVNCAADIIAYESVLNLSLRTIFQEFTSSLSKAKNQTALIDLNDLSFIPNPATADTLFLPYSMNSNFILETTNVSTNIPNISPSISGVFKVYSDYIAFINCIQTIGSSISLVKSYALMEISNLSFIQDSLSSNGIPFTFSAAELTSTYNIDNILLLDYARKALDCNSIVNVANFINDSTITFGNSRYPYTYTTSPADASNWLGFFPTSGLTLSSYQRSWSENTNRSLYFFALSSGQPVLTVSSWGSPFSPGLLRSIQTDPAISNGQFQTYYSSQSGRTTLISDVTAAQLAGTLSAFILSYQEIKSSFVLNVSDAFTSNYVDDPNADTYIYYSTYTNAYTSPTGKHPSVWRFVDSNKSFVLSNDLFGNIPYTTEAERNEYFISNGFRRFLLSSNATTAAALFRTPDQDKQNVYYLLNIAAKYVENQANLESKYDAGYGEIYQMLSIQSNTLSYIKNTLISEQAATLATIGSLTTSLCNWDAYLDSVFPPEIRVGKCPTHLQTFDLNSAVSNYYIVAGRGSYTLISQPVYVTTSTDVVVYTALASRAASLSLPTVDYVKYIPAGTSSTTVAAELGSLVDYVEGHNITYSTKVSGYQYFLGYNGSELDKMIIWTSLALQVMPIYSNLSAAYNTTVSAVRTWTYRKLLPQYYGNPPSHPNTYSSNGLPSGYDQYFGETVYTLEPYPKQLFFPTNTTMNWALLLSGGVASTETYWSMTAWQDTSNAFTTLCNAFSVSSVIVDGAIYATGGSIALPIAQAGFVPVTQVIDWMTKLQPSNIADTLSMNAKFLSNYYDTFSDARLSNTYNDDFETISSFFPYRCLSAMEIMSQAFWTDAPEQWPFEISGGLTNWKWSSNTWPRTIAHISGFTNHSGHLYVAPPSAARRLVSFDYISGIAVSVDPYSTPYFMLMSDTIKRYGSPVGLSFARFNYPYLNSISSNATSRANLLTSMFTSNRFLTNTRLLSSLTTRMTPENRFLSFAGEITEYTRNAVIDISVTNKATNNLSYRILAYSTDGVTPTNTYTGVSTVNSNLIFTSISYRASTLSSFFASNLGTNVASYVAPDPYTWYNNISLADAFSVYASNVSASIVIDSLSATLSLSGQVFTAAASGFAGYGMNVAWPYIGTMLGLAPALKYTTSSTITGTVSGTTLTLSSNTALVSGSTLSANGIIPGTTVFSGGNSLYQISRTQSVPITAQSPVILVNGSITGGINGRNILTLSTYAILPAGARVTGTGFATAIEYQNGSSYTVYPPLPLTPDRNNVSMTVTPAAKLLTGSIVNTALTLDSPAVLSAGDVLSGSGIGAGRVIVSGSGTSYVVSSSPQPLAITAVPPTKTVTGSISGTALTLSTSATLPVGAVVSGTGISANTSIVSGSGTSYVVSISQTRSSGSTIVTPATISVTGSIIGTALTLSASAALSISDVLTGVGINSGTLIVASNSGTSYTVNNAYTTGTYSGPIVFSIPHYLSNIASIPYIGVPTYASLVGKITFDLSAQDYVGSPSAIRPVTLTLCNAPTPNIVLGNISGNVLTLNSSASLVTNSLVSGLGVIPGTRIVSGSGTSYTVTPYRTALTFDAYNVPATIPVRGSISGTTLTLSTSATLPVDAVVAGGGIITNTKIVSGSGTSYVVTPSQDQNLPITVLTIPSPLTKACTINNVTPAVITIAGFIVNTTLTITSPNPQNTPLPAGAVLDGYTVDGILRGAGTRIVSGSGTSYEVYPTQSRPQGSITVTSLPYTTLTLTEPATLPIGAILSGRGTIISSNPPIVESIFPGTTIVSGSGTTYVISPSQLHSLDIESLTITAFATITTVTGNLIGNTLTLVDTIPLTTGASIIGAGVPENTTITVANVTTTTHTVSPARPLTNISMSVIPPTSIVPNLIGSFIGTALTLSSSVSIPTGSTLSGLGIVPGTTVVSGSGTSYTLSPNQNLNLSVTVVPTVPPSVYSYLSGTSTITGTYSNTYSSASMLAVQRDSFAVSDRIKEALLQMPFANYLLPNTISYSSTPIVNMSFDISTGVYTAGEFLPPTSGSTSSSITISLGQPAPRTSRLVDTYLLSAILDQEGFPQLLFPSNTIGTISAFMQLSASISWSPTSTNFSGYAFLGSPAPLATSTLLQIDQLGFNQYISADLSFTDQFALQNIASLSTLLSGMFPNLGTSYSNLSWYSPISDGRTICFDVRLPSIKVFTTISTDTVYNIFNDSLTEANSLKSILSIDLSAVWVPGTPRPGYSNYFIDGINGGGVRPDNTTPYPITSPPIYSYLGNNSMLTIVNGVYLTYDQFRYGLSDTSAILSNANIYDSAVSNLSAFVAETEYSAIRWMNICSSTQSGPAYILSDSPKEDGTGRAFIASVPPSIGYYWSSANSSLLDARMQEELDIFDARATSLYDSVYEYDPSEPLPLTGVNRDLLIDILSVNVARPSYTYSTGFSPIVPNTATVQDGLTFGYVLSGPTSYIYNQLSVAYSGTGVNGTAAAYAALVSQMSNSRLYNQLLEDNRAIIAGHDAYILTKTPATTITTQPTAASIAQGLSNTTYSSGGITYSNQFVLNVKDQAGYSFSLDLLQTKVPYYKSYTSYTLSPFTDLSYQSIALSPYTLASNITISSLDSNISSPGVGVSGTAWSNLNLFNITDDGDQIVYSISVDGTLVKGTTTIRANTLSEVRLNVELTSTAFSLSSYYQVTGTLNKSLTFSNLGHDPTVFGLSDTHPIFAYDSTELAGIAASGTGAVSAATQRGYIATRSLSCISYTNLNLQTMTQSNIIPFTMSVATGISTCILNASGFIFLAQPPNAAGIDFYSTNTYARIPPYDIGGGGAFVHVSNAVFNRPDIIITEETAKSYLTAYPYSNAYTSPHTFSFTKISFNTPVSVLTFSGGITDTTLTLSSSTSLSPGAVLAGNAFDYDGRRIGQIIAGTTIVSGSGTTYTIFPTQTISSNTQITATYLPFKDLTISSLATYNGGIGVYNSAYSNLMIKSVDYTKNVINYSLSIAGGDVLGSTTVSAIQPDIAILYATLSYTSYFLTISEIAARSTSNLTLSSLLGLSNISVTYSNLSIQGGSAELGLIGYTISIPRTGGGAVDAYGITSLSKTTSGSFLKVNLSFTSVSLIPFYPSSYAGILTDGFVAKDLSYLPPRLSNTWTENSRAPNLAVSGVSILSGIVGSNFAVDEVSDDEAFINAHFTGNGNAFYTTTEIFQSFSNAQFIVNLSDPGHLLDLIKRMTSGYSLGWSGGAAPAVESLTPLTVNVTYGGRLIDFTARLNYNYFGGHTQNINGYVVLGAVGTTYGGVKTDYRPIYTDPAGNVLQTSIYGSSYFSFKATIPTPLLNVPNYIVKAYTTAQLTTILSDTIQPALNVVSGSFYPNGSSLSGRIAYFTTNTSAGDSASNVSGYLFQTICGTEQTAMFHAQEYFSSNANTTGYAPFEIEMPATPTYRYTFSMLSFTLSSLSFNMLSYSSHVPQGIQNTLANVYNVSLAQTKYNKMTFPESLNTLLSSVSIFSLSAGPLTTTNYSSYIDVSTLSTLSFTYDISLGSSLVHRTVLPDYMLKKLSDLAIYPIYSFSNDSATLSIGLKFTFHLANLQVDPIFESAGADGALTWKTELSNLINLYCPGNEATIIAAKNAARDAMENAASFYVYSPGTPEAAAAAANAAAAKAAYEAALASRAPSAIDTYNRIISSISDAVSNRIPSFRRSILLSYQTKLLSNAAEINVVPENAPNIVDLTFDDWSLSYANYDWVVYETLCSVSITLPNPNDYSFYNNNFPYYVGDIVAYSNNQLYAVCNVLPQTTIGATVLDVDPGTINDTWKELTNALVNTYYPFDTSGNVTSYWPAGSIVWANGGGSSDRYSLYSNKAAVDFPVSNDTVYDEIGRPKWDISKSIEALAVGKPPVPLTTPHKYNLTVSHPLILAADPAKNLKKWTLIPTSEYDSTKGGFTYYSKTQPYLLGNAVIYFPKLSMLPRVFQVCNVTPQGGLLSQWTESTTIISDKINPASLTPYPIGSDGIPYYIPDELRGGVLYSDIQPGTCVTNDLPRYGTAEDDVWALPVFLTHIRRKTMMKLEFSWMNMMQNLDWATYLFYGHAYSNDRFGQAGYPLSIQTAGYSSLAGTGPLANVGVDTTTALTNPLIQFRDLTFIPLNNGLSSVSATAISAWSISLNKYSISVTLSGIELLSKTLSFSPLVTTLQNYTKSIVPEIAFKTQSAAAAALGGGILTSLASISSNLYNPAAEYLYFISKSLSTYGIISSTYSTFSADMPVVYNTKVRSPIEEVCNSLYNLNLEASNNISIINSLSVIASTQIQTAFALYTPTLQAAAAYESYLGYVNAKIATTDRLDPILNTVIVPELGNRAKTARQAVVAASNAYKKVGITAGTIAAAATKIAQNAILMGTLLSDTAVLVKKPSAYIDWSSLKIRVAKIESTTRGFGTAYDSANDLAPYQKDYMTANMDRIDLEALQTHVWSDIYDAAYGDVQTVIRLQADINQRKTWWFNYGPVVQNLINLAIKASPDNPIAGLAAAGLLNPVQSSQGIRYIDFGVGLQSYPIQDPGNTFGVIGEQSQLTLYQNQNILSNVAAVNYNVVQQNMLSNYWKCLLGGPIISYLNQVKDPPRSVFSVSDNAYVGIGSLSLPTFTPNRYGNYPLMGGMIFTGFPNTITGPAGSIMPFSLAFDYGRSPYQMKDSNTLQGIVQELDFNKMSPPEYVTDSSQFRGGDYSAPTNRDVAVMGKVGLGMIGMMAASFQQTIDPLGLMSLIGPEAGMSWPSAQHPLNTATLSLCQLYANAAARNVAGLSPDPLAIQIRQAVYEGQLDMWVLYNSILEKLDSSTSQNNGLDFSDATAAPTVSNVEDPYVTLQFIPIAVRVEGKVFDTNQIDLKIPRERTVIRKRRIPRLPKLPTVPNTKIYPAPIIVPPRRPDAPVKQAREEPRLDTLDPKVEEAVFRFKSKKPKPPTSPVAPVIEPFNLKRVQALTVTEYTVSVKMWAEAAGHAGPGSQQKFLIKSGSTIIKIRVDATGARSVVSNANAKIDYATLLMDTTAGNIPAIVDKLNEKPGRGQFASDAANTAAAGGAQAATAARKKGLARTTSTGSAPTITTYSTDYKVEDTTQVTLIEDNTAVFEDLRAAYDTAVAAKIDEFNKAKEEYRKKEQAYNYAVAAREIERAAAKGEFEVAKEQAKQKLIADNKKKLEDYAQHVLEVNRENSLIMERNRKLQERHAAAVAEAAAANQAVTLSKIADAVAQDTYNQAKKRRADIIKAQRAAEDKAWDSQEIRNKALNDLAKAQADAENVEIQAKNAAGAARADYEAARTGWGQTGSALAGIAEQGFALAGITTPTLRQAANEFLLNDDDVQITDLENNIASFAISQGISTVAGSLADFIGQVAYDAWNKELLNSFSAAKKEFLTNIKSAVRGAKKITSISALLSKIIKGFSTILYNSASSYVRSIAAANTLPGGLAILDDAVDAMGRPVKGAAAYAARTASSATSTAGRVASGLGLAGNVFGAILGAQQMGCLPPFPL